MLRPLIIIAILTSASSSSQCPANVSQGSVCMYGLTVGPNIGTEAPLRDFVSKISEIDFAGHELSLKRFGQRSIPPRHCHVTARLLSRTKLLQRQTMFQPHY